MIKLLVLLNYQINSLNCTLLEDDILSFDGNIPYKCIYIVFLGKDEQKIEANYREQIS